MTSDRRGIVIVTQGRVDANWLAIDRLLDMPNRSRLERWLLRAHVPEHLTRTVAATPALRRSWYIAVAAVAVLGLAATDPQAADPEASLFGLLFLAPLVPVLGVALAYGPGGDPAYEATLSTPASGLRLVLARTAVVVAASAVLLGVASALSPVRGVMVLAWVVPSLATSAATLAGSSVVTPRRAAAVIATAWTLIVLVARAATDDRLAAFRAAGQVTALVLTVLAVTAAVLRRERYAQATGSAS